jgi:hypothetical protein
MGENTCVFSEISKHMLLGMDDVRFWRLKSTGLGCIPCPGGIVVAQ